MRKYLREQQFFEHIKPHEIQKQLRFISNLGGSVSHLDEVGVFNPNDEQSEESKASEQSVTFEQACKKITKIKDKYRQLSDRLFEIKDD
jgi:hypothetical protein